MAPDPQTARVVKFPDLKPATRNQILGGELGTQYDSMTRMFSTFGDGSVLDYGEWSSRDVAKMLDQDGQASALEAVLTLPIRQASRAIEPSKGDSGEAELCNSVLFAPATSGGMKTPLQDVIGQVTSAQIYRKSFHEKIFRIREEDGAVTYEKLAHRPTATCELRRDPKTAAEMGFRQQLFLLGGQALSTRQGSTPGWVDIPKVRSFVHVNGRHREPLTGTSELAVCYWCYKTKLKLVFLWLAFLEQQSLPKVIVYGQDQREANARADDVASMRASGVAGFTRGPQGAKDFEVLESSGKGASQFADALAFLETWQTASVLAGFTGLSSLASMGKGSLALSQDQSAFFLKSRQAISMEIAESLTHDVIAPLVTLNFGPNAAYPVFKFGALTDESSSQLVGLFQALAAAPSLQVPPGILDLITERLATVLNLDVDAVSQIVQQGAKDREKHVVATAPPGMPKEAAASLGRLAGGTAAATRVAQQALAQAGREPLPENISEPFGMPTLGIPKA